MAQALVRAWTPGTGTGTTATITGTATTAGNFLVASLSYGTGATTVTGPSGWVRAATAASPNADLWVLPSVGTGATSYSWTLSGSQNYIVQLAEFSGVTSSGAGDGTPGGSTLAGQTGSITTTGSSDIVFAVISERRDGGDTFSAPTNSFSIASQAGVGSGTTGLSAALLYRLNLAAGTYSSSVTCLTGGGDFNNLIAAYKGNAVANTTTFAPIAASGAPTTNVYWGPGVMPGFQGGAGSSPTDRRQCLHFTGKGGSIDFAVTGTESITCQGWSNSWGSVTLKVSTDGGATFSAAITLSGNTNNNWSSITLASGLTAASTYSVRIQVSDTNYGIFSISNEGITLTAASATPALTTWGDTLYQRGTMRSLAQVAANGGLVEGGWYPYGGAVNIDGYGDTGVRGVGNGQWSFPDRSIKFQATLPTGTGIYVYARCEGQYFQLLIDGGSQSFTNPTVSRAVASVGGSTHGTNTVKTASSGAWSFIEDWVPVGYVTDNNVSHTYEIMVPETISGTSGSVWGVMIGGGSFGTLAATTVNSASKPKLMVLGDSTSAGTIAAGTNYSDSHLSWAWQLVHTAGYEYELFNFAKGGDTLQNQGSSGSSNAIGDRFQAWFQVSNTPPSVIIINAGTNDSLLDSTYKTWTGSTVPSTTTATQNFSAQLVCTLYRMRQAAPNARILVMRPFGYNVTNAAAIWTAIQNAVTTFNDANCFTLDVVSGPSVNILGGTSTYSNDGIHLNVTGYAAVVTNLAATSNMPLASAYATSSGASLGRVYTGL